MPDHFADVGNMVQFRPVDILNTTYQGHRLEVTQPLGGGPGYHVRIDSRSVGQIVPSPNGWLPFITTDVLQGDDVAALLDLINGED